MLPLGPIRRLAAGGEDGRIVRLPMNDADRRHQEGHDRPVSAMTLAAMACIGNHRIGEEFFVSRQISPPAAERPRQIPGQISAAGFASDCGTRECSLQRFPDDG